jgi:hypothetical protein
MIGRGLSEAFRLPRRALRSDSKALGVLRYSFHGIVTKPFLPPTAVRDASKQSIKCISVRKPKPAALTHLYS